MKRLLIAAPLLAATLCGQAFAADVGVSVNIGQPGFYGRIDIGDYPRPALIYPQPVMIEPVPYGRPPVYLRVPPGQAKHWSKYCYKYGACGERVYFVRDDWYRREYVPRYRERHGEFRDGDRHYDGRERHHDRHERHHEGRGRDHDGERGHGHGHGHGRGD